MGRREVAYAVHQFAVHYPLATKEAHPPFFGALPIEDIRTGIVNDWIRSLTAKGLQARILQIVDIYDALATDRPYRKAIQPEEVFNIMHGEARRGWWDDSLICKFQSMILGVGSETGQLR